MLKTLRNRILAGFALGIALGAIAVGLALVNIVRLGSASDAILRENYRSILAAEQMLSAIGKQENAAIQMVIGIDEDLLRQFAEGEREFLEWQSLAANNITIEGEAAILESIKAGYERFLYDLSRFRNEYATDTGKGREFYHRTLQPQAEKVRAACRQLHELNRKTMEGSSKRAHEISQIAVWSTVVLGLVSLGTAAGFSVWLAGRIVRPVQRLTEMTSRVAAGDYTVAIKAESSDEVGLLAKKFNLMVTKLRAYHELNLRRIVGEQKKAEAILEAIDDGILVINSDRRIISVNRKAAEIFGITHRPGIAERQLSEIVTDESLRQLIDETLDSGRAPRLDPEEHVLSVPQRGNHIEHYQYASTPISAPEGLIGVVVLLRNVTALKELDSLKNDFIMTASHELRTPLTSIAMSIELLREKQEGRFDESTKQLLDVAHEELERLRKLVSELLDLSKIQSGRLELELGDVSVARILKSAIAPFQNQADQKGIELILKAADTLPMVRGDENKLVWIITNLLGNALRYARTLIEVSAEKAGPWVNVYVRDDGPGIPYDQQTRVFEKFVQLSDGTQGGAGLGLAISKEIVRAHRGNIWVEAEPGRGTMFIVALPTSVGKPIKAGQ